MPAGLSTHEHVVVLVHDRRARSARARASLGGSGGTLDLDALAAAAVGARALTRAAVDAHEPAVDQRLQPRARETRAAAAREPAVEPRTGRRGLDREHQRSGCLS